MMFTNINIFSMSIILALLLCAGYLYLRVFSKKIHRKQITILLSIFLLLLLSILGPKGGLKSGVSTTIGSNIAFVIDVSKSMDALDFGDENISRLQMTKSIISTYVESEQTNKYALDAFSGEAVKLLPFTGDSSIYQTVLGGVDHSSVGKSGTDLIKAIYSSASHFTQDDMGGLIVIFTDGGDDPISDLGDIADVIDEKNISILIVGIGSKSGNYIPAGTDFFGQTLYKTYEGKKIITKLNSDELRSVAKQVGSYIEITSDSEIDNLFNEIEKRSEKISFETNTEQRRDLTGIFMLAGFMLWILWLGNILFSKYRKK